MKKYMLIIGCVIAVVVAVGLVIFFSTPQREGLRQPLAVGSRIYQVEVADTLTTQARGLSGRASLGANEGMLFVFDEKAPRAFWMYEMRFPIDIIWIRDHVIVGVVENAPAPTSGSAGLVPATFNSPEPLDMVLELSAGTVSRDGIMVGDRVELK